MSSFFKKRLFGIERAICFCFYKIFFPLPVSGLLLFFKFFVSVVFLILWILSINAHIFISFLDDKTFCVEFLYHYGILYLRPSRSATHVQNWSPIVSLEVKNFNFGLGLWWFAAVVDLRNSRKREIKGIINLAQLILFVLIYFSLLRSSII